MWVMDRENNSRAAKLVRFKEKAQKTAFTVWVQDAMIPLSRITRIVEQHLKDMGYEEGVSIRRGKIVIEIQIDNGRETLVVKERELNKALD